MSLRKEPLSTRIWPMPFPFQLARNEIEISYLPAEKFLRLDIEPRGWHGFIRLPRVEKKIEERVVIEICFGMGSTGQFGRYSNLKSSHELFYFFI
jgi:hypothetical protein